MFILKREALPIKLALLAGAVAMVLSLSLVVPKAGAVTIDELLAQIQALQAQLVQLQSAQSHAGIQHSLQLSHAPGVAGITTDFSTVLNGAHHD